MTATLIEKQKPASLRSDQVAVMTGIGGRFGRNTHRGRCGSDAGAFGHVVNDAVFGEAIYKGCGHVGIF